MARLVCFFVFFLPLWGLSQTPPSDSLHVLDSLKSLFLSQQSYILAEEKKLTEMPLTHILWEYTEFDFGEISEDSAISHRFIFQNIGQNDFIIQSVKTSCGCTIANWSKSPISPQQKGFVEILFDAKGQAGMRKKSVVILGNSAENIRQILYLKGEVIPNEF